MKNQTSFKKGNTARAVNPKIVFRKFKEMLENAQNDASIRCFEDACYSIGWRDSKVAYWTTKLAVFENLKKDIQAAIRRRINNGALAGDYPPAPAIWRLKMLGETESSEVNIKNNGGSFESKEITEVRIVKSDS